jgi:D-alanyl-D-alanine carboxypeptidase
VPVIPYLGTTLPPIATMIKYFGPQGDVSQETTVKFAGHTLQINKVLAGNAAELGQKLAAAGYSSYIRTVGGFRTSIGGSGSPIPFSMHQFGAAFDINEDGGPDGDWHTMTLPAELVSICASMNWFCGENWGGASRDGGHFQFTGGDAGPAPPGSTAAGSSGSDAAGYAALIGSVLAAGALPVAFAAVILGAAALVGIGLAAAGIALISRARQ